MVQLSHLNLNSKSIHILVVVFLNLYFVNYNPVLAAHHCHHRQHKCDDCSKSESSSSTSSVLETTKTVSSTGPEPAQPTPQPQPFCNFFCFDNLNWSSPFPIPGIYECCCNIQSNARHLPFYIKGNYTCNQYGCNGFIRHNEFDNSSSWCENSQGCNGRMFTINEPSPDICG